MESKVIFTRNKNHSEQIVKQKEDYNVLIRKLFRVINLDRPKQEKAEMIKKEYSKLCNQDLERNEFFIQVLQELKSEIASSKPELWKDFEISLKLLVSAEILDLETFETLNAQQREIASTKLQEQEEELKNQLEYAQKFKQQLLKRKANPDMRTKKDEDFEDILYELKQINFGELDTSLNATLWPLGSSKNGFALLDSDYDVTIITADSVDERKVLDFFYKKAKECLKQLSRDKDRFQLSYVTHDKIRVPLVNLTVFRPNKLEISFSVNNQLGCYNTNLLRKYSEFDERCQDLGLLVKIWAQIQNVSSAKSHYLSSYGYILLVINFLQTIKNPILPSLQALSEKDPINLKIHRKVNNEKIDKFTAKISFVEDEETLEILRKKYLKNNNLNTIKLLKKFFKFYSQPRNFQSYCFSIKKGERIERREEDVNLLYSIEDPFDLFNNPGRHLKKDSTQALKVLRLMEKSYQLLKEYRMKQVFEPLENK